MRAPNRSSYASLSLIRKLWWYRKHSGKRRSALRDGWQLRLAAAHEKKDVGHPEVTLRLVIRELERICTLELG
jgi:hypothetical protein